MLWSGGVDQKIKSGGNEEYVLQITGIGRIGGNTSSFGCYPCSSWCVCFFSFSSFCVYHFLFLLFFFGFLCFCFFFVGAVFIVIAVCIVVDAIVVVVFIVVVGVLIVIVGVFIGWIVIVVICCISVADVKSTITHTDWGWGLATD